LTQRPTPPQVRTRRPVYRRIADELQAAIESGGYPIGSTLPTESELCQHFGVSRHTIRSALRLLDEAGLTARRHGSGTVVISDTGGRDYEFVQVVNTVDHLRRVHREMRLEVLETGSDPPPRDLATRFGFRAAGDWRSLVGLRMGKRIGRVALAVGLARVYLRAQLNFDMSELAAAGLSFFDTIEEQSDTRCTRVHQEISAQALSAVDAERLGIEAGAPALRIARVYHDEAELVFLVSDTLHPADLFRLHMNFHRRAAPPQSSPEI